MEVKPKRSTFRVRLEEMISTLRSDIMSGERTAGTFLPSEMDLAEKFQISKNSVRKGLETLESEGLIEKIPRIGSCILGPTEKITLKFGYYPSLIMEADLNTLVDQFHNKFPNIELQLIPVSYHWSSPMLKNYIEQDNLDIVTVNIHNFEQFLDENQQPQHLEALEPKEGVYPFLNEPFVRNGELFVQPFLFSPVILCYNKQHFREHNVPEPDSSWTWDTVKEMSLKLASGKDRYGFFFHILSNNRWPIFFLQNGFQFRQHTEERKTASDNAALKESLETLSDLIDHVFPPFLSENDLDVELLFLDQKVSMILTSYFTLNLFKEAGFEYDISPLPYLRTPKTLLVNIGLAVNKNSKHKEAAKTFIDFLLSYEVQQSIRQNTLSLPSLKRAAEWSGQEVMNSPSRYNIYRETFPTYAYHTDLNITYSDFQEKLQKLKLYLSKMVEWDVFV